MKQFVQAEDLYRLKLVSDPLIAADGKTVVYIRKQANKADKKYYSNLVMIKPDSKKLVNLTSGKVNDASPVLHPDGCVLYFMRQKEHRIEIRKIRLDGGESEHMMDLPYGDCRKMEISPDGKWLSFLFAEKADHIPLKNDRPDVPAVREIDNMFYRLDGHGFRDERPAQIFLMKTSHGKFKQLTNTAFDISTFSWSPDSRKIVYITVEKENPELNMEREDIFITNIQGNRISKISKPDGPAAWAYFTPDGKNLVFSGHFNPDHSWGADNSIICRYHLTTGDLTKLTHDLDRSTDMLTLGDMTPSFVTQKPVFLDGWLYFTITSKGANPLYRVHLETGESESVLEGRECVINYSADRTRSRFVLHIAQFERPDEIWLFENGKNKVLRRVSFENDRLMDKLNFSCPEEISVRSTDNAGIQSFILLPPDFNEDKKYPLILNIHGGPRTQYGYTWFHEMHVLAASGYVVLYTNPRGSQGFGKEFANAITGKWGEPAMTDVMAAVDAVIEKGYIDDKRLYVTGGSYGGYMTNWIISQTDRFRAAVTQRSISDLGTFFGTSDIGWDLVSEFKALPWENPEPYKKWSPLTYLNDIKTPLMLIHSENDLRCPVEQAEQLYAPLKYMGRDVKFVRFPDSSHGLSRGGRPDRRIHRLKLMLEWFESHK